MKLTPLYTSGSYNRSLGGVTISKTIKPLAFSQSAQLANQYAQNSIYMRAHMCGIYKHTTHRICLCNEQTYRYNQKKKYKTKKK